MKKLITLICFCTICFASFAQTPQGVNYQGLLRDDSGEFLAERDIQVSFQLLQGSPDGTVVYNEFHNLRTSSNGVFETVLGNGNTVFGEFENIDWGAGPMFMEVSVDKGSGLVNMGTSQVVSVPYALYAEKAQEVESVVIEKIEGLNISGIEVDQILRWNGSEFVADSLDLTGSSFWNQNGSDIYFEDGAVGIGISSPQTQGLHVNNGDLMLTSETAGSPFLTMGDEDPSGYRYSLGMIDDSVLGFWSGNEGLITGRMYMDQEGHFGIGTNSPGANLYIYEEDPGVGFSYFQLSHNALGSTFGDGAQIGVVEDDLRFYNMEEEGDIVFSTDASGYDMMIDPDGKVGLGTSSPEAALDVQADVLRTARIKRTREDASAILQIEDGNENIVQIQANAQGRADYAYDGEVIMSHDQNGNMGVGTDQPQSKVHLHNDASSSHLQITNMPSGQGSADGSLVGMNDENTQIVNNEPGGDIEFYNRSLNTMNLKSTGAVETQVIEVQQTTENPLPNHVYGNSMPIAYGYIRRGDINIPTGVYNSYGIESLTWDGNLERWEVKLQYEIERLPVIMQQCYECESLGYITNVYLQTPAGQTTGDTIIIESRNFDTDDWFRKPNVSLGIFGSIAE